jgi:hypothetical protein
MDSEELLYDAWCLIANAGFAPLNWHEEGLTKYEKDWVAAAERWRDAWLKTLPKNTYRPEMESE